MFVFYVLGCSVLHIMFRVAYHVPCCISCSVLHVMFRVAYHVTLPLKLRAGIKCSC